MRGGGEPDRADATAATWSRRGGHVAILLVAALLPGVFASAHAGEVRRDLVAPSPALGGELHYTVYLPDGYGSSDERYPVIYALHGHGGGQDEWFYGGWIDQSLDRMIAAGEIRPVIVVAPEAGESWYVDSAVFGGPGDFETAIVQDLVAVIDRLYRTRAERPWRAIAGNSMGGHGALRFAFANPDRYAAVAALSPAVWKPFGVSWARSPIEDPPGDLDQLFPRTTGEQFDPQTFITQSPFARIDRLANHPDPPRILLAVCDGDEFALQDGTLELYLDLRSFTIAPELRVTDGAHDWDCWRPLVEETVRLFDRTWPVDD